RACPRPVTPDTCGILSTSPIKYTASFRCSQGGGKPRPYKRPYILVRHWIIILFVGGCYIKGVWYEVVT
ncbi:MAG: hypothetical protein ABIN89_03865, partial [Chitinophagaceae bacterium]